MGESEFVYVAYIATTPEKLWEALTDGDFTQRYWGGRRIQSDWNVGSPVRHVRSDGGIDWQGEVLQSQRPHLLSYTFHMQISVSTVTNVRPGLPSNFSRLVPW